MKNNEQRVLAYKLAKEIGAEDLEKVSGGSMKKTVGPTGQVGSMDGEVDVTYDW